MKNSRLKFCSVLLMSFGLYSFSSQLFADTIAQYNLDSFAPNLTGTLALSCDMGNTASLDVSNQGASQQGPLFYDADVGSKFGLIKNSPSTCTLDVDILLSNNVPLKVTQSFTVKSQMSNGSRVITAIDATSIPLVNCSIKSTCKASTADFLNVGVNTRTWPDASGKLHFVPCLCPVYM